MTDEPLPTVAYFGQSETSEGDLVVHCRVIRLAKHSSGLIEIERRSDYGSAFASQAVQAIFFAASTSDGDLLEIDSWRSRQRLRAPIVCLNSESLILFLDLAKRVVQQSRIAAVHSTQLSVLRQVHEDLQNTYDELRSFISASGSALPKLAFYNHPENESSSIRAAEIVQPLPIDYRRLAGVSLFNNNQAPSLSEGDISVSLFSTDDSDVLHSWSVAAKHVPKGWVTFAFERQSGVFLRKNVAVKVSVADKDEDVINFVLGEGNVRPEKACILDGVRSSKALALRCWVSPPGIPLAISGQMWPVIISGGEEVSRIELDLRNKVEVIDVLRTADQLSHPTVVWDHNREWILVHPIGRSPTVAKLPSICPEGTTRVVAEVETINERAGLVEYALATSRPGESEDIVDQSGLQWVQVPPLTPTEIHYDLPSALPNRCSLLLITRMAEATPPDFCWSHFKRIAFEGVFR